MSRFNNLKIKVMEGKPDIAPGTFKQGKLTLVVVGDNRFLERVRIALCKTMADCLVLPYPPQEESND